MNKFGPAEIDVIAKSLGWRLEFLKESRLLDLPSEIEEIETILRKLRVKTVADPDSGEIFLLKNNED